MLSVLFCNICNIVFLVQQSDQQPPQEGDITPKSKCPHFPIFQTRVLSYPTLESVDLLGNSLIDL